MRWSTRLIPPLITNGLILVGLLFLGWSMWTAVAIYWLEAVLEAPAMGYRVRRAVPFLSDEAFEAYLTARDREFRNDRSSGARIREALARGGRDAAAIEAGWEVGRFWGLLSAVMGLSIFFSGAAAGAAARGMTQGIDLSLFDWSAIVVAAVSIGFAELVSVYLDRRPVMPDLGGYLRKATAVFVIAIVIAFAINSQTGAVGAAVTFALLKTLADLRTGVLPDDAQATARPAT